MFRGILLVSSICGLVRSSGVAPVPAGTINLNPVVTAASSQYFQRTFNRLVVPPVVAPVAPVIPSPPAAGIPAAPPQTVFVKPTSTVPVVVNPPPPQELPVQPNVAVAVATAHAAAPVATILLPPYPFGFSPAFGFIPNEQPRNVPDENTKEPTTQRTTVAEPTTTPEAESTTPIDASSSDNNFVQASPSNENINFRLYGVPSPNAGPHQQQPGPHFNSKLPNGSFQRPQQPIPQFKPQQPQAQLPQFQPQQPQAQLPQFRPLQTQAQLPQFQPQQPQFRPENSQFQPQQSQLQPQELQFPPYPPKQEPRPQFNNLPTPQFNTLPRPQQQPRPQVYSKPQHNWPRQKPQKLKTSVEVVPVPLAYITPPPLQKTHAHVKVVKHIYSYVPASSSKIILKPVKIRPVRLVKHKIVAVHPQKLQAIDRDIEITTFNPFPRPMTKPPRV